MASQKQIEANKANAERSTGPKTQVGKARSRHNSRKLGLAAEKLVTGREDPAEFNELRAELIQQYEPQSALESEMVERLAGILWRLRRVPVFEAAIIDARQADVDETSVPYFRRLQKGDTSHEGGHVGHALVRDGVAGDVLGKLSRHEAALMSGLMKTLQILRDNRARREDEGAYYRSH
jgi:hypothetical protein